MALVDGNKMTFSFKSKVIPICKHACIYEEKSHSTPKNSRMSCTMNDDVKMSETFPQPYQNLYWFVHPYCAMNFDHFTRWAVSSTQTIGCARIMRKKVNKLKKVTRSGEDLDVLNYSLYSVLMVLKNHLRHLPDFLMVSSMYDLWMTVMPGLCWSLKEKISCVQNMLGQLPFHNQLVLQQIILFLHHLGQDTDIEDLATIDLANTFSFFLLCKYESWRPKRSTEEYYDMKLSKPFKFMIENACEIFGVIVPYGGEVVTNECMDFKEEITNVPESPTNLWRYTRKRSRDVIS